MKTNVEAINFLSHTLVVINGFRLLLLLTRMITQTKVRDIIKEIPAIDT